MSTTISGTTGIDKVQDGTTINASSIIGALNATGSAPIYACRAFAKFDYNGALASSGNVSSVTDNGQGDFTVNFTTAMPDINYVCTTCAEQYAINEASIVAKKQETAPTTSAFRVTTTQAGAKVDLNCTYVAFFR